MDMGKLVLADIDMGRQGKLVPANDQRASATDTDKV